jgi:hypothetical protein
LIQRYLLSDTAEVGPRSVRERRCFRGSTVFHPDPTPAHVDEKLREQAAALGADAVILVKYGKVGISWVSYGSLDGSGRAVKWK